jgi:hypothetical protein
MSSGKQLKFEDLQPHVEMLIDALENRGASSSGIPNEPMVECAQLYRNLLNRIRNKEIEGYELLWALHEHRLYTLDKTGNNQRHRIKKIVYALDTFLEKEYSSTKQN